MQRLAILGATGSIGRQTLQLVDEFPQEFEVIGLTTRGNIEILQQQIFKYKPEFAVVVDEEKAGLLSSRLNNTGTEILAGEQSLEALVTDSSVDLVVNGLVGFSGFKPTLTAVKNDKKIALANKEALVAGGELITAEAEKRNLPLLPIDSEHSAIFQCFHAGERREVKKLILTASGGPFKDFTEEELKNVTPAQALKHPTWKMGAKITVDSATLMNKGFEIIEAHWLFKVDYDLIEVVIHPQSIVHSMVEFIDSSIIAQMGNPDMFLPIQYALSYPERWQSSLPSFDFNSTYNLQFFPPSFELFPCLDFAYQAGRTGGTMPAVLSAADEVAVEKFLQGSIYFPDIPKILESVMGRHSLKINPGLNDIIDADNWAREEVERVLS